MVRSPLLVIGRSGDGARLLFSRLTLLSVVDVAHRGIMDLRDIGTRRRAADARLSLTTLPLLLPPPPPLLAADDGLLLLFDGGRGGGAFDPAPARVCLRGLTGMGRDDWGGGTGNFIWRGSSQERNEYSILSYRR